MHLYLALFVFCAVDGSRLSYGCESKTFPAVSDDDARAFIAGWEAEQRRKHTGKGCSVQVVRQTDDAGVLQVNGRPTVRLTEVYE